MKFCFSDAPCLCRVKNILIEISLKCFQFHVGTLYFYDDIGHRTKLWPSRSKKFVLQKKIPPKKCISFDKF